MILVYFHPLTFYFESHASSDRRASFPEGYVLHSLRLDIGTFLINSADGRGMPLMRSRFPDLKLALLNLYQGLNGLAEERTRPID